MSSIIVHTRDVQHYLSKLAFRFIYRLGYIFWVVSEFETSAPFIKPGAPQLPEARTVR